MLRRLAFLHRPGRQRLEVDTACRSSLSLRRLWKVFPK